jgi:hypothetical protein
MELTVNNDHNEQDIIFHKSEVIFMEQDFKNGWLRCDWDRVWSFFRTTKSMDEPEIKDFVRGAVEEHLKSKVLKPTGRLFNFLTLVEEHLKSKVLKPFRMQTGESDQGGRIYQIPRNNTYVQ